MSIGKTFAHVTLGDSFPFHASFC